MDSHDFRHIVNLDLRPQDDLYRFVNDRWLTENEIPEEYSRWGSIMELHQTLQQRLHGIVENLKRRTDIPAGSLEQKLRDYYVSGEHAQRAETAGVAAITDWLHSIEACRSRRDFIALIARLHLIGAEPLWCMYVDQDEADSSRYLLRFAQAGLTLPSRDYYDNQDTNMKELQQDLQTHIGLMFKTLGVQQVPAGGTVLDVERQLAGWSLYPADLRDIQANYNPMSFEELQRLTPGIDWRVYFETLGIDPPEDISVDQPDYFRHISQLLEEKSNGQLQDYLKWHVLERLSPYAGETLTRTHFEFFGTRLNGTPELKPLWRRLLEDLDSSIGEGLGRLYVAEYFPADAKQRMEVLSDNLKTAFADRLRRLAWMDEDTKAEALAKLETTRVHVGYPDTWRDYSDLPITPESYIKNHCQAVRFETCRQLNKLGTPVDRSEWVMTPSTVNACYDPNLNTLTFPAGILSPPLFDNQADDAINYGGIGTVIGHELTHGFDDNGCLFDSRGNLRTWWSESDAAAFEERTTVVVEQADAQEIFGRNLNGRLTLGENIADIGGLAVAYDALRLALDTTEDPGSNDGYGPCQRFFFNFARTWRELAREEVMLRLLLTDEHPPGEFRANNSARNLPAFYKVFEVTPEDGMYISPQQRVDIW